MKYGIVHDFIWRMVPQALSINFLLDVSVLEPNASKRYRIKLKLCCTVIGSYFKSGFVGIVVYLNGGSISHARITTSIRKNNRRVRVILCTSSISIFMKLQLKPPAFI